MVALMSFLLRIVQNIASGAEPDYRAVLLEVRFGKLAGIFGGVNAKAIFFPQF